jgi:predicted nucleic-acid-binding protein
MECVFVLESFYKYDRAVIAGVLETFVTGPGVEIDDLQIHLDALGRYRQSNIHIVDSVLAATAAARGLSVATFDLGLKKFSDVTIDLG